MNKLAFEQQGDKLVFTPTDKEPNDVVYMGQDANGNAIGVPVYISK